MARRSTGQTWLNYVAHANVDARGAEIILAYEGGSAHEYTLNYMPHKNRSC